MPPSNIRYVAHLDILGMSTIVRNNPDKAWEMLTDLVNTRDRIDNLIFEFIDIDKRINVAEQIKAVTFSDTIFLFTRGCTELDLRCLLILTTELFHKALCKCIPIRAGLAKGMFKFDMEKSMYCGPALIDAYHTGEDAQWLGVTLHSSVASDAIALNLTSSRSAMIIEHEVQFKTGPDKVFVINWPAVFAHDFNVKPPLTAEQFYKPLSQYFGAFKNLHVSIQNKYINTVEFINWCYENHAVQQALQHGENSEGR